MSGSLYHHHPLSSALGVGGGGRFQRQERQLNRNEKTTLCKLRTREQGGKQGSSWNPCPDQGVGPALPGSQGNTVGLVLQPHPPVSQLCPHQQTQTGYGLLPHQGRHPWGGTAWNEDPARGIRFLGELEPAPARRYFTGSTTRTLHSRLAILSRESTAFSGGR